MQNPFKPPPRPHASIDHERGREETWRHADQEDRYTGDNEHPAPRGQNSGLTPMTPGNWGEPPSGQIARGSQLYGGPDTGFGSDGGMHGQSHYGGRTGASRMTDQSAGRNWNRGQRRDGEGEFEPDYLHWREQQMRSLDNDYLSWRDERRERFASDFATWRSARDETVRRNNLSASGVQDVADGGSGRSDVSGPPADNERD